MKKRRLMSLITMVLTAALMLSLSIAAFAAPEGVQATPTASTVRINDKSVAFEAYTINGNNYFRLRDLAMAFTGLPKRFSLEWDASANAIRMMSDGIYIPIGGELSVTNKTAPVTAVPAASLIFLNGKQVYAKAYVINNTNYFKLRDIGAAMTFSVTYDVATEDIKIDTSKEYYMPALMEILPGATYKEYYTPEQLAQLPPGTEAEGFIFYNRMDSGSVTISELSRTYFSIAATGLTGANDLAKLKDIVGVFVSTPEQVMEAVNSSKTEGQKVLQLEGKSLVCSYLGQTITIVINW